MTRPAVSVVMPFAGSAAQGQEALAALLALDVGPDDELILSDNSGVCPEADRVLVVQAEGERSPSYARNFGAEHAGGDWVLFLDADCRAEPGLISTYFATPIGDDVGALAGEVVPSADGMTFAARYGAARSFLGQGAHLGHSYLPRAVAANLLVRRLAFEQVGGFYEGVRAAEDTDFSWRLQRVGWRLEGRPGARVEHRYRTSLGALRRQWRGYAAGRAWLSRRYEDFDPEPALWRVVRRRVQSDGVAPRRSGATPPTARLGFLAVDALLGIEELAGFAQSNRPGAEVERPPARLVLVAESFPARQDPAGEVAPSLDAARIEAVRRPELFDQRAAREVVVDYREDDGVAARLGALLGLLAAHPVRCLVDRIRRGSGEPTLLALAPAGRRLAFDRDAVVQALGQDPEVHATARRLAALAARPFEES